MKKVYETIEQQQTMKQLFTLLLLILFNINNKAQPIQYTSLNGHSHNDYFQAQPFVTAFEAGMGSIEADVFLHKNQLYVAHTYFEIDMTCTFEDLYILPIVHIVRSCKAYPMQLIIDVKTSSTGTLQELVKQLSRYPDVFNEYSPINIVISGNRPPPSVWHYYPSYIQFDGRPDEAYTESEWQRVGIVSDNIRRYTGLFSNNISPQCYQKLKKIVNQIHRKGKKIRFWKSSDTEETWQTLMLLGVDFINTDVPQRLKKHIDRYYHYASLSKSNY